MPIYNLYFLDRLNIVIIDRECSAPDDTAAIAHARTLCRTHAIEVRQSGRILALVPKAEKPPALRKPSVARVRPAPSVTETHERLHRAAMAQERRVHEMP